LVNSIHPRRHLFIRLAACGDSIAATPFLHSAGSVTAPPSLHLFGRRIDCRATIFSAGRPIPSPRHHLVSGPANPIAAPQSFHRAGEFHRRAAIFSVGRRIPSSRHNLFSRLAFSIVAPQSFQSAGEFHHCAAIVSDLISTGATSSCCHFILAGASSSCRHIKFSHIISKFILKKAALSFTCASIHLLHQNSFHLPLPSRATSASAPALFTFGETGSQHFANWHINHHSIMSLRTYHHTMPYLVASAHLHHLHLDLP
jgi:hypothetical protein